MTETFTISFKKGTFSNIEDVFGFVIRHLHFSLMAISSSKSFSTGYHHFDEKKVLNSLKKKKDNDFRIADDFYKFHDEKNDLFYREDSNNYVQYFIFKFEKLNNEWLRK